MAASYSAVRRKASRASRARVSSPRWPSVARSSAKHQAVLGWMRDHGDTARGSWRRPGSGPARRCRSARWPRRGSPRAGRPWPRTGRGRSRPDRWGRYRAAEGPPCARDDHVGPGSPRESCGCSVFDPTVQHLGEPGDVGDLPHRHAGVAEQPGRSSGGEDLDAEADASARARSTTPVLS